MKNLLIIAISALLLTGCAHHPDRKDWDKWDKTLYGGLVAGSVADIVTTNNNVNDGFSEQNPVCGDGKPSSTVPLNIAGLVAVYFIADYLPPTERKWLLGVSNVLRWGAVGINMNAD